MSDTLFIVLLIVVVWLCCKKTEHFTGRLNEKQLNEYTELMLQNKSAVLDSMNACRKEMPWIDAVTYEDARALIREGKFNRENIRSILS